MESAEITGINQSLQSKNASQIGTEAPSTCLSETTLQAPRFQFTRYPWPRLFIYESCNLANPHYLHDSKRAGCNTEYAKESIVYEVKSTGYRVKVSVENISRLVQMAGTDLSFFHDFQLHRRRILKTDQFSGYKMVLLLQMASFTLAMP